MKTALEILEYYTISDVHKSDFIELPPLTIVEAMEVYAKQFKYDYSKDCKCGNERIGETWCCNQCGLPVSKSENDINKMINFANWFHEMKDVDEPINSALNKPAVIRRASYDNSDKEFEVLQITYRWDKYTRKLINEPKWHHYKYYKTLNSALDATRDFRNSWYDKAYYDYPALGGGIEHEKKYPHIKPTITIHRYKAVRRDDKPCV